MRDINKEILELKIILEENNRLNEKLSKAKKNKVELESKKNLLYKAMEKEELDVKRLEGMSFNNIFHTILGNKNEKLEKEKDEALAAKLKYDSIVKQIEIIEKDINLIEQKLIKTDGIEKEYGILVEEKKRKLQDSNQDEKDLLHALEDKEFNKKSRVKEIKEAIDAGNQVLDSLYRVKEHLQSAGDWGTWDILGGGLFVTMAKHSKIDDARNEISITQGHLEKFFRELQDVEQVDNIDIEIGSFLGFADYFFDGLFADLAVQSRISESREKTETVMMNVDSILRRLKEEQGNIELEIEKIEEEMIKIIENTIIE